MSCGSGAEESPLEVLRDPHDDQQSRAEENVVPATVGGGAANHQTNGGGPPAERSDPQDPSETIFPSWSGLGNSNELFGDLDDSFWSSNFFESEMFAEM